MSDVEHAAVFVTLANGYVLAKSSLYMFDLDSSWICCTASLLMGSL